MILISCGEPSGDLYAGALTRALRAVDPSVTVCGLGGDHLRDAGAELVGHYRGLAATGLSEALAVVPRSFATYRRMVARARAERPDVFVAIDFPEINFRVAAAMRRLGVPVVYYIGPQLWAWRRGRIRTMGQVVDRVLVIFPFETEIYRQADIPVEFVGHPLLEVTTPSVAREPFLRELGLDPAAPTVALLPGSRPNELRAILPDVAHAARRIRERVPGAQFVVARAPQLDEDLFAPIGPLVSAGVAAVVEGRTDDALAASDAVVTASGTATVQAAIHQKPMVIVYRLSAITFCIVKAFSHVPNAGMVNLIAGRQVVPELLQDAFTPDAVADEVVRFLTDTELAVRTRAALADVRDRLGSPGASRRAAARILESARRTGQPNPI
ncbi:MAG: lipid-A-disaccharide synthase [Acidobacteria bacterium]|nr:lipid-A-disaccharide synthase [Acidobacteriota bacterium]MYJ05537.1 lipid-A-disaccharide synthase [Acidobacteriota bacterium]